MLFFFQPEPSCIRPISSMTKLPSMTRPTQRINNNNSNYYNSSFKSSIWRNSKPIWIPWTRNWKKAR